MVTDMNKKLIKPDGRHATARLLYAPEPRSNAACLLRCHAMGRGFLSKNQRSVTDEWLDKHARFFYRMADAMIRVRSEEQSI